MTKPELPQQVKSLVDAAKANGHAVFAITIAGTKYYYRSINRSEFKILQEKLTEEAEEIKKKADASKKGLEEKDPKIELINNQLEKDATLIKDRGEERLVNAALLYPGLHENTPAGVMTALADHIMLGSGYGNEEAPEVL